MDGRPADRFDVFAKIWATVFYCVCTRLVSVLLKLFSSLIVIGRSNIPRRAPVIVAANHLNLADPPLLAAVLPRRLRFMAKRELFARKLPGFFVRSFGAFPVSRFEADRRALRMAESLLARGEIVAMFPEGHRSDTATLLPAHPGTALLALRSGATVLPVAISGTERIRSMRALFERPRIRVTVGKPLQFARQERITSERVAIATDEIMCAIAALLPAEYRGVYTHTKAD